MYLSDNYSYSNEQTLTVKDRLTIPSGSKIPDNAIIKAGGLITIKPNVSFGKNVKIVSAVKIEMGSPNAMNPGVQLLIEPLMELLYGCSDFNYASLHNTPDEISQFCDKDKYKKAVFESSVKMNDNHYGSQNMSGQEMFSFIVAPNPNSGNFNLTVFNNHGLDYSVEIVDVTGKSIFIMHYDGTSTARFIETTGLTDGMYFVKVSCGNHVRTEKLIIAN